MKNTMKFLTVVCFAICCSTFTASAQIYVTIRPQRQVVVRTAPPQPEYVWVDEDWEWQGDRYVWVGGHWIEPRPGYVYRPGRWRHTDRGHVWVAGRWNGNRVAAPRPAPGYYRGNGKGHHDNGNHNGHHKHK